TERKWTPPGVASAWLEQHVTYQGGDCLIWPFGQRAKGYGSIFVDGKCQYASRVMCEKAHGAPPQGKPWALHSCGNGHLGCVNPNHLRWGNRNDNGSDMVEHGKSCRGDQNGRATITEAIAREILALKGKEPQRA